MQKRKDKVQIMKIRIDKIKLVDALNNVTRGMSSNATMQILKGILVIAGGDKITFIGTNLDFGVKVSVSCEVEEEGKLVIADGKLFSEMVRKLPEGEVSIELFEENKIKIKRGRSRFELMVQDFADYPELPKVEEAKRFEVNSNILKSMILKTVFATSEDETRPILQGCLFEAKDNCLNVVALDGFRLAYSYYSLDQDMEDFQAVVPNKALLEVARIIPSNKSVKVYFNSNHCLIEANNDEMNIELTARLLEGVFIKYESIVPDEFGIEVTVNKKELQESLDRAQLVAKEGNSNIVKLDIKSGKIAISANSQVGKVHEIIEVETHKGEDLEIAFNNRFLQDGLKVIDSESLVLCFNNSISPCIFKPIDNIENYKYLLLPIRVGKS